MRVLGITILLMIIAANQAMANDPGDNKVYIPKEYVGYVVYETVDNHGDKVLVKNPVKYKIGPAGIPQDNDESYQYRNYRIELEREKSEKAAKDKIDSETKKINSAMYYPLYFD